MPAKKSQNHIPAPPEVQYAVYECKWKDCQAKLHNLATLKKHIHKLHGKPDAKGRFTCKWEGCSKIVQVADAETGEVKQIPQYHHHPNQELLFDHVEKAHVGPVAWKLGDGPPGGLSDSNATDSEAYMSDARGRRVTPRVAAPEESATPSAIGRKGKPRELSIERKTKAFLKKKKEIGPGVDRGGSRLVTEKRRAGFVDDEDPEEVTVEPEDYS